MYSDIAQCISIIITVTLPELFIVSVCATALTQEVSIIIAGLPTHY